jgi:hypothetical protein
MSKIEVDQVDPQSGTTLTLGTSGDTVSIPSGVTLANAGTVTGIPTSALTGTIALNQMATGTDGNIISYDASGNPVAVATGSAGQILTSAGAGAPPTFATPAAAGKILQVKNQFNSAATASTATGSTFFDICAGSMSFTPTSSSSNILCILNTGMDTVSSGTNCGWSLGLDLQQTSGMSHTNDFLTQFGYYSAASMLGAGYGQNLSMIKSYANSSTNAITITGKGHNYSEGNSQTIRFQKASLIVMEWV